MVLKLIKRCFFILVVFNSCSIKKNNVNKIKDIKVYLFKNIPAPDNITYYLSLKDTLKLEHIDFVEILNKKDSVLDKLYSYKFYEESSSIKVRTTKFIGDYTDASVLKEYLLKGKFKIYFNNNTQITYIK